MSHQNSCREHLQIFTCSFIRHNKPEKKLQHYSRLLPFSFAFVPIGAVTAFVSATHNILWQKNKSPVFKVLCALTVEIFSSACSVARTRCGKMRVIASKILRMRMRDCISLQSIDVWVCALYSLESIHCSNSVILCGGKLNDAFVCHMLTAS